MEKGVCVGMRQRHSKVSLTVEKHPKNIFDSQVALLLAV
jgi:hypothetical protein